mgnify:CR=1 FL=1
MPPFRVGGLSDPDREPEPGDNDAVVVLGRAPLTVAEVVAVARRGEPVEVADDLESGMAASRELVERAVAEGRTVYGVTTGFGALSMTRVPPEQAERYKEALARLP